MILSSAFQPSAFFIPCSLFCGSLLCVRIRVHPLLRCVGPFLAGVGRVVINAATRLARAPFEAGKRRRATRYAARVTGAPKMLKCARFFLPRAP